jgi:hypothetical protein
MLTTQAEVRAAFWCAHLGMEDEARRRRTRSKGQNAQFTDTRCAFVDYVDHLQKSGDITQALADRVTL